MILGVNQLAIGTKPPAFIPWKDSTCIAFFLASASQTTTPASGSPSLTRATTIPNLRNPAQTLVVPATWQGPKIDTSIGGQPTWVADTLLTTLSNTSIVIPDIYATGASVFEWVVGRIDATSSGFETLTCLGAAADPAIVSRYSSVPGDGIRTLIGGQARLITAGAGYSMATAKRIVAYRSGLDVVDYLQWGSLNSGAGITSTATGLTGLSFFNRGSLAAPIKGAISAYGVFTATGANAAARTAAAAATIAKIDDWADQIYGSTAWTSLTS